MDFLRLIRSLEELLYEVMSWLLFYPRTLWRVLTHPSTLASYANTELGEKADEQFIDLMSPPLFLMLSILLAHALELKFHLAIGPMTSEIGKAIVSSDTNLLVFRATLFSLFPVVMAATVLRIQRQQLDRKSLRRPFYLQCFFAGPFVLLISCGSTLVRTPAPAAQAAGGLLIVSACVWYVVIVTRWLTAQTRLGPLRSFALVSGLLLAVMVIGLVIAALLLTP